MEDEEAEEKARIEYMWRRKCEIFNEIENLWLDYLIWLDYPNIDFISYVAMHSDPPISEVGAKYRIFIWKFVRSLSPMHLN